MTRVDAVMLMVVVVVSCAVKLCHGRHVMSTRDFASSTERRARLLQEQDEGKTCWSVGQYFLHAVCIENAVDHTVVPATAQDLRKVLYSVNLRTWLPTLLCSSLPTTTSTGAGETTASAVPVDDGERTGRRRCVETVKAALSVPVGSVSGRMQSSTTELEIFATIDDIPWVQTMEKCLDHVSIHTDFLLPLDCQGMYVVLASERGKLQLRPALQDLWRQHQQHQQHQQHAAELGRRAVASGEVSVLKLSPSAEIIAGLLSLLDVDVKGEDADRSSDGGRRASSEEPFVKVLAPVDAARVNGGAVPFIAEVYLGGALEERLLEVSNGRRREDAASSNPVGGHEPSTGRGEERGPGRSPLLPPFHRCEVRAVVDGVVTARIPIYENGDGDVTTATADASSKKQLGGGEDDTSPENGGLGGDKRKRAGQATSHAIRRAVIPDYGTPCCSDHPRAAATLAATAGVAGTAGASWGNYEDMWLIEARQVDRVCTRETFGPHRMQGELACCFSDGTHAADRETRASAGKETCQVQAISAPVEYHHTGHLAEVLSSSWAEQERGFVSGSGAGSGERGPGGLLFDPPPEEISVSVYVETAPDAAAVVIVVPRWSSDGDVWLEAFRTCSEAFGPAQGFLINVNDCVNLITTVVSAKRADLFRRLSLRMDAYGISVHRGDEEVEGHTARSPEKVEALGAMPRDGGDRVRTICEVGFNAGHSSLNWLLNSHPSTRVLAFDLGTHEYVGPARDFLQAVFPGRLELVLGDSSETVPAHTAADAAAGRDPRVCDLVFVDGNHSEEGTYADLVNFAAKTSRGWNAFALDDLDIPSVTMAWRRFSVGEGKGRLERVVLASAESYAQAQEGKGGGGSWDVTFDTAGHRNFMQRGSYWLGIGALVP